jgi:L-amino acid N-acyltransferase YncA
MNSPMSEILIRPVAASDAKNLLAIYAPYIASSHITFETEIPSQAEYEERIQKISSKFPWLVAEHAGQILGYAYATTFRERAAYGWALETSIYLADDAQGTPVLIAKTLYEALFAELNTRGIKQVIGVISLPNEKSVRFHEKMGFQTVGTFPSVGFKLGQWWDVLFMTKFLENLPFSPPVV